jgi:hypothetical protein
MNTIWPHRINMDQMIHRVRSFSSKQEEAQIGRQLGHDRVAGCQIF